MLKLIQSNKLFESNISEVVIKAVNKNDCLNASRTDSKASSCFKKTNLTTKPIIAIVPINDNDNDK